MTDELKPNADSELLGRLRKMIGHHKSLHLAMYASGAYSEKAKLSAAEEMTMLEEVAHELELMDETLYLPMSLFDERIAAMQKKLDEMTAARDNAVEALHLMQAGQI